MSQPAYSKRFFAGSPVTRPSSGTVPTGRIWVVRSIDAFLVTTVDVQLGVSIQPGGWFIWFVHMTPALPYASWRGRQVLNSGEHLATYGGATGAHVVISGYELEA